MTEVIKDRLGLGVQQPWAELILRGVKTVEVRNTPVSPGRRIYLYSSRKQSQLTAAAAAVIAYDLQAGDLPTGVVVGSVVIVDCRKCPPADARAACLPFELMDGKYSWILERPQRCEPAIAPRFKPYGMWFYPFQRKQKMSSENATTEK